MAPGKLPTERKAITHKFRLGETKVYLTVGLYEDGRPGEIFLKADKMGDALRGGLNVISILFSMALQRGIPLAELAGKLRHQSFEPSGFTGNTKIPSATSIADYAAQWLMLKFPGEKAGEEGGTE